MELIRTKKSYKVALDNSIDKYEMMNDIMMRSRQCSSIYRMGRLLETMAYYQNFLKSLGIRGKTWLAKLCTSIMNKCKIPKEWYEAEIIAILKPNKPANNSRIYWSISPVSVSVYKAFEILLLGSFIDKHENIMPKKQAGFVRGRSCNEQVLSLTTHKENGFQNKLKSGAALLDISSVYDTMWKNDMFLKLVRVLKCESTIK